ncbi:MAG TPA: hypothetical protein EYN79_03955 [Planctomycetes bacterium]|nr:hypothetical protein [Planctomycetota bacterium]HIN81011.1 hypothetical protein [Planctomycetota bacterium]
MTTIDPRDDARRLRDGLRRQREIYSELYNLFEQTLLEGADDLLNWVFASEDVVNRAAVVDAEIDEVKERWETQRKDVPDALIAEVRLERDLLHQNLQDLQRMQEKQLQRISMGFEEKSERVRKAEGQRRIQEVYGASPAVSNRFSGHLD